MIDESEIITFSAFLTLLEYKDGGRKTPIKTGVRTDIEFENKHRIVALELENKDFLFPGESCEVKCHILLHGNEELNYYLDGEIKNLSDGGHIIGNIRGIQRL